MIDEQHKLGRHLGTLLASLAGVDGGRAKGLVALVSALTQAMDDGHSRLGLDDTARKILEGLSVVSKGGMTPLVIFDNHLYFQRVFESERKLATRVAQLGQNMFQADDLESQLDLVFGSSSSEDQNDQRDAARCAASRQLCIISGGPGTGKTTTVVHILTLLQTLAQGKLKIALAAPTGKAALRLRQAVQGAISRLSLEPDIAESLPQKAGTVHRLLGIRGTSATPLYTSTNPMEWDVVVIDEASMVDLAMMSKLIDGMKNSAQVILLGDRDQLASVEAGAVLGDLTRSLPENTVILRKSYRFDEGIAHLARLVNEGNAEDAWKMIDQPAYDHVKHFDGNVAEAIEKRYSSYIQECRGASLTQYHKLFGMFGEFQVLCATRSGRSGVERVNHRIERKFTSPGEPWYTGRPVMIMVNDYSLGLYNGDVGICLPDELDGGSLKVWFEGENGLRHFLPQRLPQHESCFAMTIHKSQGSEFDNVLILLPDTISQILSRELVYTAITRARRGVELYCKKEIFSSSLHQRTRRSSGLMTMLSETLPPADISS